MTKLLATEQEASSRNDFLLGDDDGFLNGDRRLCWFHGVEKEGKTGGDRHGCQPNA